VQKAAKDIKKIGKLVKAKFRIGKALLKGLAAGGPKAAKLAILVQIIKEVRPKLL
jgi:hypothetical protein